MRAVHAYVMLAVAFAEGNTPIQKVIDLLNSMKEKGTEELKEEEIQFQKYNQWCEDTIEQKAEEIENHEEKIEVAKATIKSMTARINELTNENLNKANERDNMVADKKASTSVRKLDAADFQAKHTDLSESISAITRAIQVLKKQDFNRKQAGEALLQVRNRKGLPQTAKQIVDNFLQSAQPLADTPEANAYEFQGGKILSMLGDLLDNFRSELKEAEKVETESQQEYDLIMQESTMTIQANEETIAENSKSIGVATGKKGKGQTKLDQASAALAKATEFKSDTENVCGQKSAEFKERTALRNQELEAIEQATQIIASRVKSKASSAGITVLQKLLQVSSPSEVQQRVASFLKNKGDELSSKELSALSVSVSADVFKNVRKMIQSLIFKLQEQAKNEAEQKGWCDKELNNNKLKRKKHDSEVSTTQATTDQASSTIAEETENIEEATETILANKKEQDEATTNWKEAHAENQRVIRECVDGALALEEARAVLEEFYAKAKGATSLMQQSPPPIFSKPYKGQQGGAGGVLAMIEVIASDFERLRSETDIDDKKSEKEFKELMNKLDVDTAKVKAELANSKSELTKAQSTLTTSKLANTDAKRNLKVADAYYDKLKPTCVDSGVSFEERTAQREAEMESLQEALDILSDEGAAV